MSYDSNAPATSVPQTPLVFPPVPLASGDTRPDADGIDRRVTAVTVRLALEGTDEPGEVTLEYRFGGWWAPTGTIQSDDSRV